MLIKISSAGQPAQVLEVEDLRRFSVAVLGAVTDEGIRASLGALGHLDSSDHAWISIEELRAACGVREEAGWVRDFEAMVGYAASNGWLDESKTHLHAHLDRVAAE